MMDPEQSVLARLERLEAAVEEIRHSLTRLAADAPERETSERTAAPSGIATGSPLPPSSSVPPRTTPLAAFRRDLLWDGEFWLNKLGIGLLLLGVAFLFRYSIDQGWITPGVRVGFGLALGTGLLVAGLRLDGGGRRFVPVLVGGGIATFYIVGFAAFQLYDLIGYRAAFAGLLVVTLTAFGLAVRRDEFVLGLIGTIGGLGTPFLLYTGSGRFAGLIVYTCLVLLLGGALYLGRGWRSVLWVSAVGGWWVLWISYADGLPSDPAMAIPDRRLLQAAILLAWGLFWGLPVVKEAVTARGGHPAHIDLLSVSTPLAALLLSKFVWEIPATQWGWIVLGGAAVYVLAGWALFRPRPRLAEAQLLSAAILAAIGAVAALDGSVLLLALTAEAGALHLISRRTRGWGLAALGHALFAVAALWLAGRLAGSDADLVERLTDLAVLGAGLAISAVPHAGRAALAYRFFAHAAFLGWLWREFGDLANGAGYVTIAWGGHAVLLLVLGLQRNAALLQRTAIGTLLLVVAKLFLVDLAALEAIWRILLFLGLGGGFLFLSYSLQALWKPVSGNIAPRDGSGSP